MNVGVALGGGGVRGMAHVLALETLDAYGIRPTAIVGTSIGAIVGAYYAAGHSGQEIREQIEQHIVTSNDNLKDVYLKGGNLIKWLNLVRPAWSGGGLLKADGFLNYFIGNLQVKTFEELQIPLSVVATDFYSGDAVVFESGPLLPAIRSSFSIPGVFVPVEHNGRVLVDGGMANNLPYELLRDRCDVTIAIDVAATRNTDETTPPTEVDAILGMFDMLIERLTQNGLKENQPTIYIRPTLVNIRVLDFDKIETVFEQSQPAIDELKIQLDRLLGST